MAPKKLIEKLAQDVYRVYKNRAYDDIEGDDGQAYVEHVIAFANMWRDEIEYTTDPLTGESVDWKWGRTNGYPLGLVVEGARSISTPVAIDKLLAEEGRYVQITQDGTVVANFAVVDPKQITNKSDRITEDMCAQIGGTIVFSRAFRDTEAGGAIIGDVTTPLQTLSATNVSMLKVIKPYSLLVLGIAKNTTLPDIVQGKLSPAYVQKYDRLLAGAMARNRKSSMASEVESEDYSNVGGVY